MDLWLKPFAHLYRQAANFKNFLYDHNILKSIKVQPRVISIGNLTVGGTGKTPVVRYLVRYYLMKNKKVAVVARAYRAQARRPVRVVPQQSNAATLFGDEATMLAQVFPEVAIFVGQDKAEICQFAIQQGEFDVILIDDGFQHRALARDLDIVLIDASEPLDSYEVLPLGRGREPWSALERASVILLTKTNLVSNEKITELIRRIPKDKRTFLLSYQLAEPRNLLNSELKWNQEDNEIWLVSGLAKPYAFQKLVESKGFRVLGHSQFRDHHPYTNENLEKVLHFSGSHQLLTTEKDAVKLKALESATSQIWVVPLEIQFNSGENEIHEILAQIVHD